MEIKINYKKVLIYGFLVLIIDMIIGNILYLNPFVSETYKNFEGHASLKPIESFGSIGKYITITMLFSVFFVAFLIFIFLLFYINIPGKRWQKGLYFGILVALLKAVPEAFNQYMNINYPGQLILIQLLNTFIGLILFGIYLEIIFRKSKTIEIINE